MVQNPDLASIHAPFHRFAPETSLVVQLLGLSEDSGVIAVTIGLIVALIVAIGLIVRYARDLAQGTALSRELAPVPFRWGYLAPVLAGFVVLAALAAYLYPLLPAEHVASHFNVSGAPDDWQSRGQFLLTFLGMGMVFMLLDGAVVLVATREPLIAFERLGSSWRLDPQQGLIYTGATLGLVNLLLAFVLLNTSWYTIYGAFLFPFSAFFWLIIPLVAIIIVLFFVLARRNGIDH
ncbi:MAG: DUF1648 domain-containing protein [Chloroflexi bacterium]|nr:DUF1648 domain-containing protein [Chloroflexota bacterium]